MKKFLFLFLIVFAVAALLFVQTLPAPVCPAAQANCAGEEIFFCPADNCSAKLISQIDSAEKTVHVAIYSFTLDAISDALISAKNRGLEVKVLMEKQQAGSSYSDDEKLVQAGIEVKFMNNPSGIMHNKFTVIDSAFVATGSFNYTANADEHNNENLVFLNNTETAKKFETEFQRLWAE
ncbi:MAG: phospholipase D family protein [Candidatus ainarchaeum sp.]|nr:phospholipase D family protein [Candidatus ainarchaeum sp.]